MSGIYYLPKNSSVKSVNWYGFGVGRFGITTNLGFVWFWPAKSIFDDFKVYWLGPFALVVKNK